MNKKEMKWLRKYNLAKRYYEEHGNLLVPSDYECFDENGNVIKLGNWISSQKKILKRDKNNIIIKNRVELLNKIGMVWERNNKQNYIKWNKNYLMAKKYYEEYGNLLIPINYECTNIDGDIVKLGLWISTQRKIFLNYKIESISEERIRLLNEIGMVWKPEEVQIKPKWLKKYELAKKYYEEYGDLLVPSDYECFDEKGNIIKLGNWISSQRSSYINKTNGSINEEKIRLLSEIGMIWNTADNFWNTNYNLAKEYYKEYGNLLIPTKYYFVNDKYNHVIDLSSWISTQRKEKDTLSKEQINLLDDIKMIWNLDDVLFSVKWQRCYELAKNYYEKYGDLLISSDYEYEDRNRFKTKLGNWIQLQRKEYIDKTLSQEKIELLNHINMEWKKDNKFTNSHSVFSEEIKTNLGLIKNRLWRQYYIELLNYRNRYGDIFIDKKYIDSSGSNMLYDWFELQKQQVNVDSKNIEQIKYLLLNEIDSNWKSYNNINVSKFLENVYDNYLYGLLDQKEVQRYINSGALNNDAGKIDKSDSLVFVKKIGKR